MAEGTDAAALLYLVAQDMALTDDDRQTVALAAGLIEQQAAKINALEEEASMYRFIRSLHWHDSPMAVVMNPKEAVKLGHWCPFGDLLDAEVKRLMKEKT